MRGRTAIGAGAAQGRAFCKASRLSRARWFIARRCRVAHSTQSSVFIRVLLSRRTRPSSLVARARVRKSVKSRNTPQDCSFHRKIHQSGTRAKGSPSHATVYICEGVSVWFLCIYMMVGLADYYSLFTENSEYSYRISQRNSKARPQTVRTRSHGFDTDHSTPHKVTFRILCARLRESP